MSTLSELQTIRDFLRYAATRFNQAGLYFGHGTDNAWDEAAALILHTLHLPHDVSHQVLDARLVSEEKSQLIDLISRRVEKRIPLAYFIKEAWFSGISFYVDERVLIPRSPIAELIEQHFQPWVKPEKIHHILDLCTGSGCIAVALAHAFPEAQVDASDISDDALAVAKINILRHNSEDQVHLYKADLFTGLPEKKYDLIVSNPPYVSSEEMNELPQEYRHEPVLGLAAGTHGLDIVKRILFDAANYIAPRGTLIVEVGNSEYALMDAYPDTPFTWLEFERGGGGVFLLTAEQLKEHCERERAAATTRSRSNFTS
ncbi:MAG TPA: 50S ribosomal protein L3 N(5)-glutamine methyltransferase [Gammaproteobacteria bacterium]|jgi:ribosomal protein L3 glutamine methyltransferase|nr:50S ribosomal protein L3 N(5)-glutamine methyltransferase [Gammaproteobacteria bacterium]